MISFGVAATTEAIAAKLSGGERHQGKIGLQHGHSFHIRFLLLPFADSCSHIIYVGAKQRYEPTPSRNPKKGATAAYGRGELYGQQIPQCLF